MSRSGGMYFERFADDGRDFVRPLHLQGVMIDDADDDLLVLDHVANRLEIAGARRAGLEGQSVGVERVERGKRRLVALDFLEDALLRGIAPAGVAPYLGLATQPFHRVVEDLDQIGAVELAKYLAAHRHHMDLRLFHLHQRAAGVGEIVQLGVERVAKRPGALDRILVEIVLAARREQLRQNGAELDRPHGHALGSFPHRGVLQVAAAHRADDPGKDTGLERVMQDVTARIGRSADIIDCRLRLL